ncbi:MAG: hypothetical protein HQ507_00015 [Candidatus Marinimicrobia bacterium]|nr:hypothetical protein [Candidatus Neomarinimicrobiota bacterium]
MMIIPNTRTSPSKPNGFQSSVIVLLAFMLMAAAISVFMGQDNSWDLRNYHLYNAYAFITDRSQLDILPAQLQSFFNPLPDILLLNLIGNYKPIIVGMLLGMIHGINSFLIFKIAQVVLFKLQPFQLSFRNISLQITPFKVSIFLGIAALVAPMSIMLMGTSYHDNLVSIPLFISILLIVMILQSPHENQSLLLILAGISAGISFGLKMTSAIYIIAVGLTLFIVVREWSTKIKTGFQFTGGVLVGIMTSGGFWYVKMWKSYKNPFFPWFNNIFHSPELLDINIRDARYLPTSFLDGLLYPIYFMYNSSFNYHQGGFRDMRFAVLYLLIAIFCIVVVRNKFLGKQKKPLTPESQFIILLSCFAYVIWLIQFSIYRYIFLLEGLAFLSIAIILIHLFQSSKTSMGILSLLVLISLSSASYPKHQRLDWRDHYINGQIPDLEGLDSAVIILGGKRPSAFFIPGFPVTTRFVRLSSNMHGYLSPDSKFKKDSYALTQNHPGPFYLLSWEKFLYTEQNFLHYFNMEVDTTQRWHLQNPHEPELTFWKVNRE